MNNEQINDSVFEALFRQAVIDDYIEEIESIPPNEELADDYYFSPEFELRMKKLFARNRRKDIFVTINKFAKKVAVILIVMATALFGILLTNQEVRAAVRNVIVKWYEQFTSFTYNSEVSNEDPKDLYPYYLPDGYFEDTVEILGNMKKVNFSNDTGDKIWFSYRPGKNTSDISVDNENHKIEDFTINGKHAFIVHALNDESYNGIICDGDGYIVELWGMLPVDDIIKIAESVSDKNN